jgi:alkylhydroperoxidase/carboxymuconolactone decarboxylase family protein YurZ
VSGHVILQHAGPAKSCGRALSKRERGLITVASLVALYRTNELPNQVKRALDNGVTREELVELATHLAIYAGGPGGENRGAHFAVGF